jgi:hypothetical protein
MKSIISRVSGNSFRNAFAGIALAAALVFGQSATAQSVSVPADAPVTEGTAGGFQAAIFPVANTASIKLHLENPAHEFVSVVIMNESNEIVYQKRVGKQAIFLGKFSLEMIPDGEYTMVVKSRKHQISRDFTLQTQVARVAQTK